LIAVEKITKPRVRRASSADLSGDIALEQAGPEDQQEKRKKEALVERHCDMAAGHRHRAEHDCVALADPAVGDPPAKHRREIDEARVKPEYLRGELLRRQRPEHMLDRSPEAGEARHMLDMARQQQLVDHVQHQQRDHAVIGKALPRLGESQEGKAPGMAEEAARRRLYRLRLVQSAAPRSTVYCGGFSSSACCLRWPRASLISFSRQPV
jgi:hypothetical protein